MSRWTYLLDTNAASDPAKPSPDGSVLDWLREHEHAIAVPIVTVYELRKGIEAMPFGSPHRRLLERRWRRFLLSYQEHVLPFDFVDALAAAEHYQRLRADLGDGCLDHIGWTDFLIAAQAHAHGLIVVTRNVSHFPHCDTVCPWPDRDGSPCQ